MRNQPHPGWRVADFWPVAYQQCACIYARILGPLSVFSFNLLRQVLAQASSAASRRWAGAVREEEGPRTTEVRREDLLPGAPSHPRCPRTALTLP